MPSDKQDTDWTGKRVFTTGEAAKVCKVSQQTIIRCFDSGRLQGFRVPGSKFRRIPRDELIRFMRNNDIPLDTLEAGKKRVLIVDDDRNIIEFFKDLFAREEQIEIRCCTTGYDAGMLTERFKPHLIILDYMLPDINGDVVCDRIRKGDRSEETSILFVSGVVERSEVEVLLRAGADGFIKKPFHIDELMSTVNALLGITEASATTGNGSVG